MAAFNGMALLLLLALGVSVVAMALPPQALVDSIEPTENTEHEHENERA